MKRRALKKSFPLRDREGMREEIVAVELNLVGVGNLPFSKVGGLCASASARPAAGNDHHRAYK